MAYDWNARAAEFLRDEVRRKTTQGQLVERTGIPIATLQRILSGKSDPGEERLERIAAALGISVERILQRDGRPSREIAVPIYDIEVAAGAGRFSFNQISPIDHWPFPAAWLGQFGAGAELKLVTVAGDSQEPELGNGDMVMIDTAARRLRDGMHVVRLSDVLMIKRVQVQGKTILLKSANPSYDDILVDLSADQDQFEVIGQAVWASKML